MRFPRTCIHIQETQTVTKRRKTKIQTKRMAIHSPSFLMKPRCTSSPASTRRISDRQRDKELDLVHSRLFSLERLRLTRFAAHLQKLCLRQNFIANLDPEVFSHLTKLVELDLYDNKIKRIGDALNNLKDLT